VSEPILVVAGEPDEQGMYRVQMYGREYALACEPYVQWSSQIMRGEYGQAEISMRIFEMPLEPRPPFNTVNLGKLVRERSNRRVHRERK
jgi:hypothetical protein